MDIYKTAREAVTAHERTGRGLVPIPGENEQGQPEVIGWRLKTRRERRNQIRASKRKPRRGYSRTFKKEEDAPRPKRQGGPGPAV